MSKSPNRSFEKIANEDIARLAELALIDFGDLFTRREHSKLYKDRVRLLCLCQGAARHYLHGDHGVNDFDIWGFFEEIPGHPFPCRRRGTRDFGASKFGRNPDDGPSFHGRRVDVIGRSILMSPNETPTQSVQRYLREQTTKSARLLSERPVIVAWPSGYLGQVIWPR